MQMFQQKFPPRHYFARAPLLHPGRSAAQDDCDWFKEIQTRQRVLVPYTRMIVSRARPSSSADTALKQSVDMAGCARLTNLLRTALGSHHCLVLSYTV